MILKSMRPSQWVKNLVVFAGLVFSQNLFVASDLVKSCITFCVFCLVTGAVYTFNDIIDRDADSRHPWKRLRPIASGQLKVGVASSAAAVCCGAGLAIAFALHTGLGLLVSGYVVLNICYSMWLKRVPIIDLFPIPIGFVIRAAAGGEVLDVTISSWLIVCTFFLALFLATGKRRGELLCQENNPGSHRDTLKHYTVQLLDHMITVVATATLIAYALYTASADVQAKLGTQHLFFTIPFVVYGIFRYMYLVHGKGRGECPTRALLTDRALQADVVLWGIAVLIILY